jgi:hypothetical protein
MVKDLAALDFELLQPLVHLEVGIEEVLVDPRLHARFRRGRFLGDDENGERGQQEQRKFHGFPSNPNCPSG